MKSGPAYGEGREALLVAAVTVVARGGLRSLTYRAVAEQAGLTHGLVRHHFGSRDALIVAATEYSLSPLLVASGVTATPGTDEEFAQGIPNMIQREQDLVAFQYEVMLESLRRPELQDAVRLMLTGLRDGILADLRERGLPASADFAAMVTSALDGIVLHGLILGDLVQVRSSLREFRQLLSPAESIGGANSASARQSADSGPPSQ